MKVLVILVIAFLAGYYFGSNNVKEKIVYQTRTEYVKDPNSIPRSVLDSEIAKTREGSYNIGYAEGRNTGIDEGYKSGYAQGTQYGQSIILNQIDLRVREAERTNQNIPLFRVRQD